MFEISLRLRFLAEFLHLRNVPSPASFSLAHTGGRQTPSATQSSFGRWSTGGRERSKTMSSHLRVLTWYELKPEQ